MKKKRSTLCSQAVCEDTFQALKCCTKVLCCRTSGHIIPQRLSLFPDFPVIRPPDPVLGGNFSGKPSVRAPHHLVTCPACLVSCSAEQGSGHPGSTIGRTPRAQNSLSPTPGPGEGEEGVETNTPQHPSFLASVLGEK